MTSDLKKKAGTAYREKTAIKATDCGIPLKDYYTSEDIKDLDLDKDISVPGQFPYTRGIYANMYRGRLWSRRELCGFGSPKKTNERIKFLVESGESGINFITDLPTHNGIDSDHPRAVADIGRQGVPICNMEDAQKIIESIPLDSISVNVTSGSVEVPACYLAAAKKAGYNPDVLMGTTVNDNLHFWVCGFHQNSWPISWGFRCAMDWVEYCIKNMPRFNPLSIDVYDYRENGISAVMEVAFALGEAREYIKALLERGLHIDEVAPRVGTVTHSSESDFFEEIAKLRAARKLWAKMVKKEFGAAHYRSLRYKFHVHTAGNSLAAQQPIVNVVRVAYQSLAAVLAGCQSMHTCSYDEAMGLPTEESHELALRTQQVLAYETGVTAVSDPLGGSYYIEWLTNEFEKKVLDYLKEIEKKGGMKKAIQSGWVENEIVNAQYAKQKEIDEGKKTIIGVNKFRKPFEEEKIHPVHHVPEEVIAEHLDNLKKFREKRDDNRVIKSLEKLFEQAKNPTINLVDPAIEAAEAGATVAEMRGAIRKAHGEHFDPFEEIKPTIDAPFLY